MKPIALAILGVSTDEKVSKFDVSEVGTAVVAAKPSFSSPIRT
jgi:hypothetical protein